MKSRSANALCTSVLRIDQLGGLGGGGDHEVDGKSPPPGSGDGTIGMTLTPAIRDSAAADSSCSCCDPFVRSFHGLVTMPPKPRPDM